MKIDFGSQRKIVTVQVPEGTVRLRALSVGQLQALQEDEKFNIPKQLAMAIVDENGQRIYITEEDVASLQEMSVTTSKILLDALNQLHGISPTAVENTVKN